MGARICAWVLFSLSLAIPFSNHAQEGIKHDALAQQLQNHWYSLKFDDGGWRSYGILISVAAALLALAVLMFLFWNHHLRIRAQRAAQQMQRLESTLPGALYEFVTQKNSIGEFRYFSESLRTLLGLDPSDMIGSANLLMQRIHPEGFPRFLNASRQSAETGKPFFIEARMMAADGSWRWIQTSAATQGDDPEAASWSGFMLDISDRKRLEHATDRMAIIQQENEAISRLLKEKEHVVALMLNENRNAATSALSASIAHQLNQPLGASSLNIQFLKRQLERNELSPSLGREILDNLDDDNQRAANIIQALRAIFLDDTPPPPPIDFNEQIQAVLSVVRPIISQANISLSLQFSYGLRVEIHQNELQKVLFNLIINAIEALNTAASSADASFAKTLTLCSTRVNDYVQFTVTDNGVGVPAQKIKSLFELMASNENEPSGLGLWLCQHIVHRYSGRIWHEQPGETGSRFVIELPLQNN